MQSPESNSESNTDVRRTIPELALLGDMPMDIEVILDQKVMSLGDIVKWQVGSILSLPKPAGEPLEIVASGELLGHGEIEVSHDTVGLRISGLAV